MNIENWISNNSNYPVPVEDIDFEDNFIDLQRDANLNSFDNQEVC